jgi:hypothetical protein
MTRSRRFFASSPWIATGTPDYVNLGYTSRGLAKQALMRLSRKSLAIFRKLGLARKFPAVLASAARLNLRQTRLFLFRARCENPLDLLKVIEIVPGEHLCDGFHRLLPTFLVGSTDLPLFGSQRLEQRDVCFAKRAILAKDFFMSRLS